MFHRPQIFPGFQVQKIRVIADSHGICEQPDHMAASVIQAFPDSRHAVQHRGKLSQRQASPQQPGSRQEDHEHQINEVQKTAAEVQLHHLPVLSHGHVRVLCAVMIPLFRKQLCRVEQLHLEHGVLVGKQILQISRSPAGIRPSLPHGHAVARGVIPQNHHRNPDDDNPQSHPGRNGEYHCHGKDKVDSPLYDMHGAQTAVEDSRFRAPGHFLEKLLGVLLFKGSVFQLCQPPGDVRGHPLHELHIGQVHLVGADSLHGGVQSQKPHQADAPQDHGFHGLCSPAHIPAAHICEGIVHDPLQQKHLEPGEGSGYEQTDHRCHRMERNITENRLQTKQAVPWNAILHGFFPPTISFLSTGFSPPWHNTVPAS